MSNEKNIPVVELVDLGSVSRATGIPLTELRRKLNGSVTRNACANITQLNPISPVRRENTSENSEALFHSMEKALRESEERYQFLYNNTPALLHSISRDGRFISVSDLWLKTLGYEREEVIGNYFTKFLTENACQYAVEYAFPEFLRTGAIKNIPLQFRKKNGDIIEVLLSAIGERDVDGNIVRSLSIAIDVTEKNTSEQSMDLLRTGVEQATDSIMITSPDLKIQFVNAAFERSTGYSREEVIDRTPFFLGSEKEKDRQSYRNIGKVLRQGNPWTGRMKVRRKDGTVFEEEATIYPVPDEHGSIRHYTRISRDITDKVRLENQLRQAQKMEAMGRLAGGIAHDFNNLLTGILGYVELARNLPSQDESVTAYFDEIASVSRRAVDLVRQLLIFSRDQAITPVYLDINTAVESAERLIRRVIGENIELVTVKQGDLPRIKIAASYMDQVIINLAINARDAMPDGGRLTIESGLENLDSEVWSPLENRDQEFVLLKISDNGTGMEDAILDHIFEPFFTTKSQDKGTGLGLSTVYGIVKQAGGYIQVDSTPGAGSTFRIYFPPAELDSELITETTIEKKTSPHKATETLLVVEDNEVIVKLMSQFLSRLGYHVDFASDGTEALFKFETMPVKPALAIIDLMLPDVSGIDLASAFRNVSPRTKVLFMSGYAAIENIEHGFGITDVDFIEKPFQLNRLAEKVGEMLNRPEKPE